MEETDQDIASAFAVGLIIGVNKPGEVIAWADSVVGDREYPPVWVIPIALAQENDRLDLLKLLHVAPMAESETMRWCLVCEAILRAKKCNACSLRTVSSALTHCRVLESEEAELAAIEARYEASDRGEADWESVNDLFLEHIQRVVTSTRLGED
ncbi:MAG: hypothetical protein ACI87O_003075 [Planctomycetota bacterium]|jgi:hypothetical protein